MAEMETLSRTIMRCLAISLDLEETYFHETFGDCPNVQMKICSYPPKAAGFGVGPHTDSEYLSLLVQDQVGGLQVQNGEGEWIHAPPIPGTIVVNLGEMIQLLTNGYYLATPHRVMNVSSDTARLSVPMFWNPRLDFKLTPIDPLPETLEWNRSRPAPETLCLTKSHTKKNGSGANTLFDVYGLNVFKSLARSHPEVMRQHHPDLKVLDDGSIVFVN